MWEASAWKNEELLWASMALYGGIAGEQGGTCGAIASSAVYLGLRHRQPLADQARVKGARLNIEREAGALASDFKAKYGSLVCRNLVGLDLSNAEVRRRFQEQNLWKDTCDIFVRFVIARLYALEIARSPA